MAVQRDRPYPGFNFLVDLGTGATDGPDAGFEECGPLALELGLVAYRNGNEKQDAPRLLSGLERPGMVTLRRGMTGSLSIYRWFDDVRNGAQDEVRTVTISLQSEDHAATVVAWRLLRARPVKYVVEALNAKSDDVAIEELTLAYERLEME